MKTGVMTIIFVQLMVLSSAAFAATTDSLFYQQVAKISGVSETEARTSVNTVFSALKGELEAGHKVTIRNFGRFYVRQLGQRKGRNPKTGKAITIPARKYPRFSASDKLKEALNR